MNAVAILQRAGSSTVSLSGVSYKKAIQASISLLKDAWIQNKKAWGLQLVSTSGNSDPTEISALLQAAKQQTQHYNELVYNHSLHASQLITG